MKVRARFSASHRLAIGTAQLETDVPEGTTVRDLLRALAAEHPALEKSAGATLVALNGKRSSGGEILQDGDELALFPPLTGG